MDMRTVRIGIGHNNYFIEIGFGNIKFEPKPAPMALIIERISSFLRISSILAFSVLMTLPLNGKIAWKVRSRPSFAEPPADSPSTKTIHWFWIPVLRRNQFSEQINGFGYFCLPSELHRALSGQLAGLGSRRAF